MRAALLIRRSELQAPVVYIALNSAIELIVPSMMARDCIPMNAADTTSSTATG